MAVIVQRQKHLATSQASWVTARVLTASLKPSLWPLAEAAGLVETAASRRESGAGLGCPELIRLEGCKSETVTGIDLC